MVAQKTEVNEEEPNLEEEKVSQYKPEKNTQEDIR